MTQAEAQKNSQLKMLKIQNYAKDLKVELRATTKLDPRTMCIVQDVLYIDMEEYDIEKAPEVVRGPETEEINKEQKDAEPTNLQ